MEMGWERRMEGGSQLELRWETSETMRDAKYIKVGVLSRGSCVRKDETGKRVKRAQHRTYPCTRVWL